MIEQNSEGVLRETRAETVSGRSALSSVVLSAVRAAMKKYKVPIVLLLVLLVVSVAAVIFTSYKLTRNVGGGMTPQGIREISRLVTIEYRYRDVIVITEEEKFLLFGLWDIDPREHILIIQYDGIIKLGIDCEKILFNEYTASDGKKTKIEIKLPDAEIISSETPIGTFKVILDRGVYTKDRVNIGAYFRVAAERQERYNEEALSGELAQTARENAKKQLRAMLESFPKIRDNYELIWVG